ncbi:hypothetical protein SLEP1_g21745 [Rubroshorea leprosula]|uniref:Uncharacterized protein n=1 Tax=Rubroshorea leprosula TaxID=152421 RepID=A0AAV5JED8_9ROSI|nr:hypothetical protein SLEP1_g21745 [Rubroshorea leprosula]
MKDFVKTTKQGFPDDSHVIKPLCRPLIFPFLFIPKTKEY